MREFLANVMLIVVWNIIVFLNKFEVMYWKLRKIEYKRDCGGFAYRPKK